MNCERVYSNLKFRFDLALYIMNEGKKIKIKGVIHVIN
jgi:hypothetical protein